MIYLTKVIALYIAHLCRIIKHTQEVYWNMKPLKSASTTHQHIHPSLLYTREHLPPHPLTLLYVLINCPHISMLALYPDYLPPQPHTYSISVSSSLLPLLYTHKHLSPHPLNPHPGSTPLSTCPHTHSTDAATHRRTSTLRVKSIPV